MEILTFELSKYSIEYLTDKDIYIYISMEFVLNLDALSLS